MTRLKKSLRTDDGHIPGNQERALRYPLNFSDSLISSQETETDTEEIIEMNSKEIIDVNQEIGEKNHAEQILKKIVEKRLIGSNHKAYQRIEITEELTELINQNTELKNQIEKLRKDFELMKSTLEILLRSNNSLPNLETQKLIDEIFLKLDEELNDIHSVNKFTNIEAYNNKINFEAFNYQQILKMINNLKSDLKSTGYYWCWIDEFVPGHKFLETISQ
ncbi:9767_t:CDS:2, partial [Racocetra persica]